MNIIFIGNSNISLSFLKLINKYDFKLFVFISNMCLDNLEVL